MNHVALHRLPLPLFALVAATLAGILGLAREPWHEGGGNIVEFKASPKYGLFQKTK